MNSPSTDNGPTGICHWMDIGIEERWNLAEPRLFPSLRAAYDPKVFDSEQLALIWAGPADQLVLRRPPDPDHLCYLQGRGFAQSTLHVLDQDVEVINIAEHPWLIDQLRRDGIALRPYVASRRTDEAAERHDLTVVGGHWRAVKDCNNKVLQNSLLRNHGVPVPEGAIFGDAATLLAHLEHIDAAALGYVLKTPYGASGKALFRLDRPDKIQHLKHLLRRKAQAADGPLPTLLERWYEVRRSVSYTLRVDPDEAGRIDFIREQVLVDGVYRGFEYSLSLEQDLRERLAVHARAIARALSAAGLRDVANIDAIETSDGTLFPAIDINARHSLATYFEKCVGEHAYSRTLYFDIPLNREVAKLLELSCKIESQLGVKILVASVSRPDRHGLSRVFVLFSGADEYVLDEAQNLWCARMSIPARNIPGRPSPERAASAA